MNSSISQDQVKFAVLEKLLNQINVGHNHATAAVALQTELVHCITRDMLVLYQGNDEMVSLPVGHGLVSEKLNVTLPKITSDLEIG